MAATSSGGPGGERAAAGEALDSDRSRTPEQRPRPGVPRTVAAAALLLYLGKKAVSLCLGKEKGQQGGYCKNDSIHMRLPLIC
jgi:hypothetical protein